MSAEFTFVAMSSDVVDDFVGCSEPVCICNGDIHRANTPFATYIARWFEADRSKGIDLQVTLGEWTPQATWQNRHTVGLHVSLSSALVTVFVDPDAIWSCCMGVPYSPSDADHYPVGAMAKELALAILTADPALAAFLQE